MICNNCQKYFCNKSNLNRHIKNYCKGEIDKSKNINIPKDNKPNMNDKFEIVGLNKGAKLVNFIGFPDINDINQSELRYIIHQNNYIIRLTKLIYIDTPIYRNVYMTTDETLIYSHGVWAKDNYVSVCNSIIDYIMNELSEYVLKNENELNKECYRKVMRYLDKYYNTKNRCEMVNKIRLLFINHKDELKPTF